MTSIEKQNEAGCIVGYCILLGMAVVLLAGCLKQEVKMIVQVHTKSVYGVERKYFVNAQLQKAFTALTGRRTLDDADLRNMGLFAVGFEEVVLNPNAVHVLQEV